MLRLTTAAMLTALLCSPALAQDSQTPVIEAPASATSQSTDSKQKVTPVTKTGCMRDKHVMS